MGRHALTGRIALAAGLITLAGCKPPPDDKPQKSEEQVGRERQIDFYIAQLEEPSTSRDGEMPLINLMRLGGLAVPKLIEALDARRENIRHGASTALAHIARQKYHYRGSFSYKANDVLARRRGGVEQFKAWWRSVSEPESSGEPKGKGAP